MLLQIYIIFYYGQKNRTLFSGIQKERSCLRREGGKEGRREGVKEKGSPAGIGLNGLPLFLSVQWD